MAEQRPAWRIREDLRRRATEIIQGRAAFERDVRPATKPLPKVEVDPHDLLAALDERDVVARTLREFAEQTRGPSTDLRHAGTCLSIALDADERAEAIEGALVQPQPGYPFGLLAAYPTSERGERDG